MACNEKVPDVLQLCCESVSIVPNTAKQRCAFMCARLCAQQDSGINDVSSPH